MTTQDETAGGSEFVQRNLFPVRITPLKLHLNDIQSTCVWTGIGITKSLVSSSVTTNDWHRVRAKNQLACVQKIIVRQLGKLYNKSNRWDGPCRKNRQKISGQGPQIWIFHQLQELSLNPITWKPPEHRVLGKRSEGHTIVGQWHFSSRWPHALWNKHRWFESAT